MMKMNALRALLGFSFVSLLGCTGVPVKAELPNYSKVSFRRPLAVDGRFQVTNKSNRQQLVMAGINAFHSKQWLVAAGHFERASQTVIESEGARWATACWGSAAISYLNGADRAGFLRAAGALKRNLSFHDRVSPAPEVAAILGLKARMEGNLKAVPTVLPRSVRNLLTGRNGG